jgi:hypothetical protein
MKARAIWRLLGVLAVLAAWVGISAVVRTSAQAHAAGRVLPGAISYGADGGEPTPPPLPMNQSVASPARSGATNLADGGEPTPPPLPMNRSVVTPTPTGTTYLADGGEPTPHPLPMNAFAEA